MRLRSHSFRTRGVVGGLSALCVACLATNAVSKEATGLIETALGDACLTVETRTDSTTPNAIVRRDCRDDELRRWRLGKTLTLSVDGVSYCLAVQANLASGEAAVGRNVRVVRGCTGRPEQRWKLSRAGIFFSDFDDGKWCLQVNEADSADHDGEGRNVLAWPQCDGRPKHVWTILDKKEVVAPRTTLLSQNATGGVGQTVPRLPTPPAVTLPKAPKTGSGAVSVTAQTGAAGGSQGLPPPPPIVQKQSAPPPLKPSNAKPQASKLPKAPPAAVVSPPAVVPPKAPTAKRVVPQSPAGVKPEVTPVQTLTIGKWPEGLAFVGESLWVAESGQRTIAEIDPFKLKVRRRLKVGRLPVALASDDNDTLYASIVTDRVIKRVLLGSSKVARVANVRGSMDRMDVSGKRIWAVTWPNDSSAQVQVVAIDPGSGKQRKLPALRAGRDYTGNTQGFAVAGGKVWLGFNSSDVVVQDASSGRVLERFNQAGYQLRSVATDGEIVAVGGTDTAKKRGVFALVDAKSMKPVAEGELPKPIGLMSVSEGHVFAVALDGDIFLLDPSNGKLLRHIRPSRPIRDPRAIKVVGYQLFITAHGSGNAGLLVNLKNWAPKK